jgi:hypothetical protein
MKKLYLAIILFFLIPSISYSAAAISKINGITWGTGSGNMSKWNAAGAAAAFDRSTIASLQAWYKADNARCATGCTGAACSVDNTAIVCWPNSKTPGTNDLTLSTGTWPTFQTNEQNSKAAIQIYASDGLDTGGYSSHEAKYTMWFVYKTLSTNTTYLIKPFESTFVFYQKTGTEPLKTEIDQYGVVAALESSASVYSGAYHTIIVTFSKASASPGNDGTAEIFYDGTSIGSTTTHNAVTAGTSGFSIVAGDLLIGELGICNDVLSAGNITSLQAALKVDWGTP